MLACAAGLVLAFYVLLAQGASTPGSTDFFKLYSSWSRVWQAQPPYWLVRPTLPHANSCENDETFTLHLEIAPKEMLSERERLHCLHPNLNSPAFVLLSSPLGLLNYESAWYVWCVLSMLAGCVTVILCWRTLNTGATRPPEAKTLALGLLFFLLAPSYLNFMTGQVGFFFAFFLCLSWRWLRKNQLFMAGLLLGVLASMKFFLGLFAIMLLISGQIRALCGFCTGFLAVTAITLLLVDTPTLLIYWQSLQEITWQAMSWNSSYHGVHARIMESLGTHLYAHHRAVVIAASLMTLLAAMWSAYNMRALDQPSRTDLLFAVTSPAMLLLSPLGWIYYFPMLLPGFVALWQGTRHDNRECLSARYMMIISVSLVAMPRMLTTEHDLISPMEAILTRSLPTYALLLMLVIAIYASASAFRRKNKT